MSESLCELKKNGSSSGGAELVYYFHSDRVTDGSGTLLKQCYIDIFNGDNGVYEANTNYVGVKNKNTSTPYEADMLNSAIHVCNQFPKFTVTALKPMKVYILSAPLTTITPAILNSMVSISANQVITQTNGGTSGGTYYMNATYFLFTM
jgi:hypothetical protein